MCKLIYNICNLLQVFTHNIIGNNHFGKQKKYQLQDNLSAFRLDKYNVAQSETFTCMISIEGGSGCFQKHASYSTIGSKMSLLSSKHPIQ